MFRASHECCIQCASPQSPQQSVLFLKPKFYKRYVDDIFKIVKKNQFQITLDHFSDHASKPNG